MYVYVPVCMLISCKYARLAVVVKDVFMFNISLYFVTIYRPIILIQFVNDLGTYLNMVASAQ
jgi:hypothetical protein